ncbi:DNA-processing protein DprA [Paraburkholderia sp.]|uniref:DNA-processing protein DprA n=1 Tax=Paraburkholderia sp. TaxID=1926495 RepID=UPI0025EDA9D5|nr:DNA-processing protein DprA [Paraburkholderia sp.]
MLAPLPIGDEERSAWLHLATARGLKPAALRTLLAAFGLPQNVLAQPFAALAAAAGSEAARAAVAAPTPGFADQFETLNAWCATPGNALVTLADPAYPPRLLAMPDPPPLLYVQGRLGLLHARSIAVVGSRSATPQALEDAARFARAFATAGATVVSGLALGVDGAAHRGALDERGGTAAVVGTGADLVYPRTHRALAAQIAQRGAILSEWPLGTPARSANFPQRNRLIAALVEGVVIVEAAMRSGSLITARLANEMGRDVFALPGSIHAPLARGCHRLIKEGAQLVESPEEVLEALGIQLPAARAAPTVPAAPAAPAPRSVGESIAQPVRAATHELPPSDHTRLPGNPDPEARRVLDALGHAPATLEILAARTELSEATLQAALLQLELSGQLNSLPGGWFVRATLR